MHSCPSCDSTNLQKRGTKVLKRTNSTYRQYSCNNCGKRFNIELVDSDTPDKVVSQKNKKYVFTSYQMYTDINEKFLKNLSSYSYLNGAELYILTSDFDDTDIEQDEVVNNLFKNYKLTSSNININDYINVYASLKLSRTAENPLSGLDALTKGKSLIVGHPTLQMETLPVFGNSHPIMMHTTGTISVPQYNEYSKAGAKAAHNHSYSALVVELDVANDLFHLRVLNADDDGNFTDLDTYYYTDEDTGAQDFEVVNVEAIVLGDTHVTVADDEVSNATFFDKDSMINVLKPKTIVHHDILDFGLLQSHHNKHSFIKRYQKWVDGKDSVLSELNNTANFLLATIPSFVEKVLVVSSNHNDHLTQYLDSGDVKHDYKNAKIYHFLMYKVLAGIEAGKDVNPFKFFMEEFYKNQPNMDKVHFLEREDVHYIKDILVSSHGDRGVGGSMFSPTQGRKYPMKTIVGHSHSPSINGGCYQTGTMTGKLDYTIGTPSAWMNTHCIIHKTGKRQLVSVIRGKWRLD